MATPQETRRHRGRKPTFRASSSGGGPQRWRADLALIAAAFLFGGTFVVVQGGVEHAEPVPFVGARYLIGTLALVPIALLRRRSPGPFLGSHGIVGHGVVAGIALAAGYIFQTVGLQYTSSSTSAFITYLLVVFVPFLSAIALRRLPSRLTVAGLVMAVVGLVLLTGGGEGRFGRGELLTLGCAVAFAAHIVILAEIAHRHDPIRLTLVQLATVFVICGLPGFALGGYGFGGEAWAAAAATGVGATAIAFVLQVSAQRVVGPTRTAIILLLEPVFAAGLGYGVGDRIGWLGALGAVLILAAVVVSEVLPQMADRVALDPPVKRGRT